MQVVSRPGVLARVTPRPVFSPLAFPAIRAMIDVHRSHEQYPMKLTQAITEIRNGDVLLFRRSSTLFGRLIRFRTQSPYSHAGIAAWMLVGGRRYLCVIEAMEGVGVRVFPLPRYLEQASKDGFLIDWFEIIDTSISRDWVAAYAMSTVGKKYASPWQFVWAWGCMSQWVRRIFRLAADTDSERLFCSELVAAALEYSGYVPDADLPQEAAETSPGAIALFPCLRRRGSLEP